MYQWGILHQQLFPSSQYKLLSQIKSKSYFIIHRHIVSIHDIAWKSHHVCEFCVRQDTVLRQIADLLFDFSGKCSWSLLIVIHLERIFW